MNADTVLATFAQVGLTLAGFTGLVGVFRQGEEKLTPPEIAGIRLIIEHSFGATLIGMLPLVLSHAVSPLVVWRLSSSVLAAFLLAQLLVQHSRVQQLIKLGAPPRRLRQLRIQFFPATAAFFALQIANVFRPTLFLFAVGLLWLLIAPTIQFYHFVLGPARRHSV